MRSMKAIGQPIKILFVYLAHPRMGQSAMEQDITELWHLVETLGNAQVVDLIHQKGPEFDATYIGPGKAEEVSAYLEANPVDIIVLNGQLTPGQKFTLLK